MHTSARFGKEKRKGSKESKKGNKDKEKGGKLIREIFYFTMFSAPRGAPGNFRQTGYRAHRHPYSFLNSKNFQL